MKIASLLAIGLTAMSVTLAGQGIDSNAVESSSESGRRSGWSGDFTIAGFTGHDGGAPVVYDFARGPDGTVIATGRFQWSGDRRVDPVVQLDGDTWQPVRKDWGREVPLIGFSAIAVSDTGEIALSTYSGPFGAAPSEIWVETPRGVQVIGTLRGSVRSMVWFEQKLWVGGFFAMDDGGLTNLAVWDGATWSAPPGGPANGAVYRLSVDHGTLLMAGDFTSIGGIAASRIAEWDGTDWTAYDLTEPIQVQHVYAVTRSDTGELFAGGAISGGLVRWTGAGWEPVNGGVFDGEFDGVVSDFVMHRLLLARWDGVEWEEIATPEHGLPPPREGTVHSIRDLVAHGRYVIAAGSLWPETGGRNVFIYDERQRRLAPLGGGLNAISIDAVALAPDGLWFGGEIAEAGFEDKRIPSIGIAHFQVRR